MSNKFKDFLQNVLKPFTSNSNRGQTEEDLEAIAAQEQKQFPFETLKAATKDFDPTNKLGQGGFGPVYKGKLSDGRQIAVKKLAHGSNQGKREFQIEAKLLTRMQHRNVVNLLGYCVHDAEKLLVYEYVANESLDKLLFNSGSQQVLDWKQRHDIITGIAKGLVYLHEGAHTCVIHRDIKASNILLDDKWVPKISDFGMARLFPEDQSHVNTRVAGTNGYIAPEYLMHGELSVKADVFSFGVLVLELISGQKNLTYNHDPNSRNLLELVYRLYKQGRSLEIADHTMAPSAIPEEIAMCIQLGLLCTQADPALRPNMHEVVLILSRKPSTLKEPTRPGFPGSRYRRTARPLPPTSGSGTSGEYSSRSSGSTTNTNSVTSTWSLKSPRLDPHGKRPM
ncbi:receptor kinase At4g00960 [Olea europaea subsp. europaea]|uniref:Receptor kinase At4g00960 n=2 Tax=Olea europaea subsp. europaea TaxID=158383 RepID=A0A8S0V6X1_OLEEU|nr:receptor kinase At4g00960 [Olea europaea subsp. europaea]